VAFCDKETGFVGRGRERKAIYLDFGKAFNTVFCCILIAKLVKCGLERWNGQKVENEVQRVVFTDRVKLCICK